MKRFINSLLVLALAIALILYYFSSIKERTLKTYIETSNVIGNDRIFLEKEIKIKFSEFDSLYKCCQDPSTGCRYPLKPPYDGALLIKQQSDSLVMKIQDVKSIIFYAVDKKSPSIRVSDTMLKNVVNKNDYSVSALILLGNSGKDTVGKAFIVKRMLTRYCKFLRTFFFKIPDTMEIMRELNTQSKLSTLNEEIPWETYTFKNNPMILSVIHLSELQTNIRRNELNYATSAYQKAIENKEYFEHCCHIKFANDGGFWVIPNDTSKHYDWF